MRGGPGGRGQGLEVLRQLGGDGQRGGRRHQDPVPGAHRDGRGALSGRSQRRNVEDGTLVLPMQMTDWEGYRSHQDNPEQFVPGDSAEALVPQELPAGAKLTYWSADDSICTVAMGGGVMVLPGVTAPEVCKVFLKVEAPGFADRTLFAELPVLKENDVDVGPLPAAQQLFLPGGGRQRRVAHL